MKKWILMMIGLMVFLLSACNQADKEPKTPEMVDVTIQLPSTIQVDKAIELQALVTQGDEKVNDADEVLFEIWKEGATKEEHTKTPAKLKGEGVYSLERTFKEPGTYYIISHVTARDLHVMPKKEFTVVQ